MPIKVLLGGSFRNFGLTEQQRLTAAIDAASVTRAGDIIEAYVDAPSVARYQSLLTASGKVRIVDITKGPLITQRVRIVKV